MRTRIGRLVEQGVSTLRVLGNAGMLDPLFLASMARSFARNGPSLSVGITAAALRGPDRVAIVDERGELSFGELDRRVLSIAAGLAEIGVRPGGNVGILCRNHRGFIEASAAVARLGANSLFLNTGFAGPQLGEVLDRESAATLVFDDEFTEMVDAHGGKRERVVAWHDGSTAAPTLDELVSRNPRPRLARPPHVGGTTILTSGTTGTPKGATRSGASTDSESTLGVLEVLPIRVGGVSMICAPSFHAWGLTHTMSGIALAHTLVLHRRFDPERVLDAIERHRVESLVVVPVMMQRILALPPEVLSRYDTTSLRATLSSGSALPGELAIAWMDAFGDNLYNFYGSTEVAQAACAGPADLRAAPGTAGRPPRGATVRILDDKGRPVPQGTIGRIFVGNKSQFEGYTGGGGKEVIDGLMSIGDVGYFDAEGRLFVEGRDDDMIVSGGENVFPREIEDLLSNRPEVLEAAVIGVPDDDFGQRLRAFVVLREGASLDEAAVKELVKGQLARHKVPRDVIFLDEIPRNPTGKVLKRVLREHA